MTDPVYHKEWINRTHNPHPREFIRGYHTGAVCEHNKKGHLRALPKHRYIDNYKGKEDPKYYSNYLYENPRVHNIGYHERSYLLKGVEWYVPIAYEKPYYIEKVHRNDTVTRHDLQGLNQFNGRVLATRLDDHGVYDYHMDPLYNNKIINDETKMAKQQKRNEQLAQKRILEKEATNRVIDRNAMINKKVEEGHGPIYTNPQVEETITTTEYIAQPMYREETVLVPVETIYTEVAEPTIDYSKYVGDKDDLKMSEDMSSRHPQMASTGSNLGGMNKQSKQVYRQEKIVKKSNDGGMSWVSDDTVPAVNQTEKINYVDINGNPVEQTLMRTN
ncbi:hypothetical protein CYY_007856 [Polysphondylium violaceum]|uniref:Uncharacterized protein n=1 Tax=Polysphondylium violaceum TaxID=133409 RepID=A0A8J4V1V3_9MYCE|nr:hypothetical protein CYY_007856 [Polysphondylium violaceum]